VTPHDSNESARWSTSRHAGRPGRACSSSSRRTARGSSPRPPGRCRAPATNSIYYTLYQRLPNDTDLTVFKRAGLAGVNFAFVGAPLRYHTPRDDLAHLDSGSLQHHGDHALAMVRALASEGGSWQSSGDERVLRRPHLVRRAMAPRLDAAAGAPRRRPRRRRGRAAAARAPVDRRADRSAAWWRRSAWSSSPAPWLGPSSRS
jgi:hypothetical protein